MQCATKCPPAYIVPSVGSQTVPFTQDVPAKALLGQALPPWTPAAQIVLLYRTCKSLNSKQNRTLPQYTFPRCFPDKQRLTSSRPDAI
eukprot:906856-Pelagomonas_calceolata.AAC.2